MTQTDATDKPKLCLRTCCSKTALACTSVLLIGLIAVLLAVIWVATGPRSVQQFVPEVVKQINEQLDGRRIEMDDIQLAWNSWQSPLDMHFTNVKLYADRVMLADLEQVAVSANVWAMLTGNLVLDRVTIYKPVVNIYRKPSGRFTLDLGYDTSYGPDLPPELQPEQRARTLAEHLQGANVPRLLGLSRFSIRQGVVNLGDTRRGLIARFHDVNFAADIDDDSVDVQTSAQFSDGSPQEAILVVKADIPMHAFDIDGRVAFKHVKPKALSKLDPSLAALAAAQLELKGAVDFEFDEDATLESAIFDLQSGEGHITSEHLTHGLTLHSASFKGQLLAENKLQLDRVEFNTDQVAINAQGSIWQREDEQIGADLHVATGPLPLSYVDHLWPASQSPVSREWVTSNLTNGTISGATLKVKIEPGMLDWDQLPAEAIAANVKFQDTDIRFLPTFETINKASGSIDIDAKKMTAHLSQASFLTQTALDSGQVLIDDLNADNPNITVDFSVQTSAKELTKILSHPSLEIAQEVHLLEEEVTGRVAGKASMTFPFTLPRGKDGRPTKDAYQYNINASLQKVSIPTFLEAYELSGVSGELHVDPKVVKFEGVGDVFDTPLQIDVKHRLRFDDALETEIAAFGNVTDDFLRKFDVDVAPYVTGTMGLTSHIKRFVDDRMHVTASAALDDAQVTVSELDWQKPAGSPATVKLVAENSAAGTHVSSVELHSGSDVFEGSMRLGADGGLQEITATTLTLGDNDLQLSYAPIDGGYKIYAKGEYFDANRFLDDDEDFSFKDTPALDVLVDLKKLVLDDGRYIENLTGRAECDVAICKNVAISGQIQGAKPMVMSIGYEGKVRRLKITTEDAGGLLTGLNVYENMKGGKMDIDGVFNDRRSDHPLKGKLHIWDFEVHNTPILARIVTLASFGGILDALSGSGLSFGKMKSDFVLADDVIKVSDMRATGDSIGITADGEINLNNDTMFIKGLVIPSHTINSFLKNVPIVGDILTGGEAIIAANYKVSGDMEEPEVSVNPLSALAPGFLRKIFE